MTCNEANSVTWRSTTFFTIQEQVEEKLTIEGARDWLGDFPHLHDLVCISSDEYAQEDDTEENPTDTQWLLGNFATSYLKSCFPDLFLVANDKNIYASEHPSNEDNPLVNCCVLIDLFKPKFAWLTLLLKMLDAVAANQPGVVPITVAQASDFLAIARDFDENWVSH